MTHPSTHPFDVKCPFCFAEPGQQCFVRKTGTTTSIHKQRGREARKQAKERASYPTSDTPRATLGSGSSASTRPPKALSNSERITTLEARVTTQKHMLTAMLHSHQSLVQHCMELSNVVREMAEFSADLESKYKALLLRQSVQLVMDGLDGDQPTHEDVWEIDEWREGVPLVYRTEPVVPT